MAPLSCLGVSEEKDEDGTETSSIFCLDALSEKRFFSGGHRVQVYLHITSYWSSTRKHVNKGNRQLDCLTYILFFKFVQFCFEVIQRTYPEKSRPFVNLLSFIVHTNDFVSKQFPRCDGRLGLLWEPWQHALMVSRILHYVVDGDTVATYRRRGPV